MTQERYHEAAEHVVREGGLTHTCETCRVALEALSKLASGWVLVPVEPTPGLLASMALRDNHGFGLEVPHAREAATRHMRQLHEEVVGRGFYQPEKEEEYAAMIAAAPKP